MTTVFDYNGTLAIEGKWLWENGIISYKNYGTMRDRKKITVLQRSAPGRPAIVEYNSLPYNIKSKIEQKLKATGEVPAGNNEQSKPQINFFEAYVKPDPAAMAFFTTKYTGDFDKINRYYQNAIVLNAVQELLTNRTAQRRSGGMTGRLVNGLFSSVIADLKSLSKLTVDVDGKPKPKYPHTLPVSERNLRPLLKEYKEMGYAALIHANDGNVHAQVVTPEMELLFISVYVMKNKPYASWVHEDYTDFMDGKKDIVNYKTGELLNRDDYRDKNGEIVYVGESTIWYYLNKPHNKLIIASLRSSNHTFHHKDMPHYIRVPARYSLSKVTFDDRDLPRPLEGGGHVYAYYAFDVMSGMCIGAAYSRKKDEKLFIDCLRNMYHNLNDWGLGFPLEGEFEHHICGNFKDTMLKPGNLFKYVTFCAPSNSQEKTSELFIRIKKYVAEKRLQENIGRHYAKLEANRTEGVRIYNEDTNEYEHRYKTFSYDQLVKEDLQAIEYYNNYTHRDQNKYPGQSIRDAFFANVNPGIELIDNQRVFYFLGERQKTSISRNQYIDLQYAQYWLSSPKVLELLAPNNYSVTAHWMPGVDGAAMGEAYIYQGDRFICRVCKLAGFTTAKAEWTDADTLAKRLQEEYIGAVQRYVKIGRDRVMGVELSQVKQAIAATERMEDYIVAEVPVEQPNDFLLQEYDEQYYLENARQKAYAI